MTVRLQLVLAFARSHPRAAALAVERLPAPERGAVLRTFPPDVAAPVMRELGRQMAAAYLADLGPGEVTQILIALRPDESADLLRRIPPDRCEAILAALSDASREQVRRVMRYPEGTAGALMDPSILELPDDISVGEAQERVRAATRDLLYYLYVVSRSRHLVGVMDIPELMSASPTDALRSAMHERVDSLTAWAPPSVIRTHEGWRSYHAMPVVDEEGRLLGAIRYQMLRRLEQDAAPRAEKPATVTILALGELFRVGATSLVGTLVSSSIPGGASAPNPGRGSSDVEASDE
jgi:magnesium transporter